jgi:DNA-binding CsgD family transcriptional regulator
MTALRSAELIRALGFVEDLHAAPSVHDLRLLVRSELPGVVGCDYARLEGFDPDRAGQRERWRYELALPLPAPSPLVATLRIGRRTRDFTSTAREVLELLRPHLIEALEAARLREAVAATGAATHATLGVALVSAGGRVEALISTSAAPLAARFEDRLTPGAAMPDIEPNELVAERIEVRALPRSGSGWAFVLEALPEELDREALAARGLTVREVEVLGLVACGCTNKQLGLRLGISPRTVQKHLERIHSKLGVSTRTAAVAVAIGVISNSF